MIGTRSPLTQKEVSLEPLFEQFDKLRDSFDVPLQKNGLNIEALAALDETVLIGFRGPYPKDEPARVLIAEFPLHALENGDFSDASLHEVSVSAELGRGIRGMERSGDSVFLLLGDAGVGAGTKPDCDQPSPHLTGVFSVHRWQPGSANAEHVMDIVPPDPDWKAEGLLPLDATRFVVFFDGPPNGSPHIYSLD